MIENGKVVNIDGDYAIVRIDKKSECDKCGMCLFPKNANHVDFSAKNGVGAEIGDTVQISTEQDGKLLGAVLVFLVPLILIGLSAIIEQIFIKSEIWMLILSVIFIILWYTVLAIIDKRLKRSKGFCPTITSIILKERENEQSN